MLTGVPHDPEDGLSETVKADDWTLSDCQMIKCFLGFDKIPYLILCLQP